MRVLESRMIQFVKPMPLATGPKQAVVVDAMAQIESYLAARECDPATAYPICARLRPEAIDVSAALQGLAESTTVEGESVARAALLRESRRPKIRPLSINKNREQMVRSSYVTAREGSSSTSICCRVMRVGRGPFNSTA